MARFRERKRRRAGRGERMLSCSRQARCPTASQSGKLNKVRQIWLLTFQPTGKMISCWKLRESWRAFSLPISISRQGRSAHACSIQTRLTQTSKAWRGPVIPEGQRSFYVLSSLLGSLLSWELALVPWQRRANRRTSRPDWLASLNTKGCWPRRCRWNSPCVSTICCAHVGPRRPIRRLRSGIKCSSRRLVHVNSAPAPAARRCAPLARSAEAWRCRWSANVSLRNAVRSYGLALPGAMRPTRRRVAMRMNSGSS